MGLVSSRVELNKTGQASGRVKHLGACCKRNEGFVSEMHHSFTRLSI